MKTKEIEEESTAKIDEREAIVKGKETNDNYR